MVCSTTSVRVSALAVMEVGRVLPQAPVGVVRVSLGGRSEGVGRIHAGFPRAGRRPR